LDDGVVYHTYLCYARGLEAIDSGYQLLDRAPKGRDEDELPVRPSYQCHPPGFGVTTRATNPQAAGIR
jgi:predicted dithiol-disulfide oxidoreductase (DUF899 family)